MAMPSGNAVVSDGKSKFQAAAGAGEMRQGHQPPMWFHDERDGFISWLRGEFAAANAIIDGLCHHLPAVGEPGEYDALISLIQQRRSNWTSVLHMQQYFPVSEIFYALNQVSWKRQHQQQHRYHDRSKFGAKEFRRTSPGFNKNQWLKGGNAVGGVHFSEVESCTSNVTEVSEKVKESKIVANPDVVSEDEKGKSPFCQDEAIDIRSRKTRLSSGLAIMKSLTDVSLKISGNPEQQIACGNSKSEAGSTNNGCMSTSKEVQEDIQNQSGKQSSLAVPKTFIGNEIVDGKMVNVVEGMKLYGNLLDDTEVKRLVSLVNDLRAAGKRGQFQGQTYYTSKRPMRGHGREIIQLGLPVADAPFEDEKDWRIEAIPALLQEAIERIIGMNIITVKPVSCIIDFYNEGDHSQPYSWPYWFGRPICMLSLTECDLTFGKVIAMENPGNFKGSLKLSLAPGSLLVMQGKSADLAKYALPSFRKQRILVTFTKSQPQRPIPIGIQHRILSPAVVHTSHGGSTPNKPLNHNPKYFGSALAKNVLPVPPIIPSISGMQPLLVAAPSAPFPTPVPIPTTSTSGWAAAPPLQQPAHPGSANVPGTGVFLPPPGSGNPSSLDQPPPSSTADQYTNVERRASDKENCLEKSDQGSPECNGNINGEKITMKGQI